MINGFSWNSFLSNVIAAALGYLSGLFTNPPGGKK